MGKKTDRSDPPGGEYSWDEFDKGLSRLERRLDDLRERIFQVECDHPAHRQSVKYDGKIGVPHWKLECEACGKYLAGTYSTDEAYGWKIELAEARADHEREHADALRASLTKSGDSRLRPRDVARRGAHVLVVEDGEVAAHAKLRGVAPEDYGDVVSAALNFENAVNADVADDSISGGEEGGSED